MVSSDLKDQVKYAEFEKLDMRVGKVLSAEDILESSKLLKFTVAAGSN